MDLLDPIRARYLEVNGDHPMTDADDEYVRRLFVPLAAGAAYSLAEICRMIEEGTLPIPSYLLGDGTPMVHPGYLDLLQASGGPRQVRAWFEDHWPGSGREVAAAEWEAYLSGQYVCLYRVTPQTIQAKARLIDRIQELVALVESGLEDEATRDELRHAVEELDALEPPFAPDYDRLRFGGPLSRDVWIDDVRARFGLSTVG